MFSKGKSWKAFTFVILLLVSTLFFSIPPLAYALNVSTSSIRAPEVWAQGINGAGVTVAIIDYGINYTHPDLQGAILHAFTYGDPTILPNDTDGHGTRVAGVIAGRGVVNPSYKGVAWGANLVVIKIREDHEEDDMDDAVDL